MVPAEIFSWKGLGLVKFQGMAENLPGSQETAKKKEKGRGGDEGGWDIASDHLCKAQLVERGGEAFEKERRKVKRSRNEAHLRL